MAASLGERLTGEARTQEEIREAVDLFVGDVGAKQSRFWLLLGLSTMVATAGVLGDSTATVIGAMIIAPLATPQLKPLSDNSQVTGRVSPTIIELVAATAVGSPGRSPSPDGTSATSCPASRSRSFSSRPLPSWASRRSAATGAVRSGR
jgi:hypothetical protein